MKSASTSDHGGISTLDLLIAFLTAVAEWLLKLKARYYQNMQPTSALIFHRPIHQSLTTWQSLVVEEAEAEHNVEVSGPEPLLAKVGSTDGLGLDGSERTRA